MARAVSRVWVQWSMDLVGRTGGVFVLALIVGIGIEALDRGSVSTAAIGDRAWTLMPLVATLASATVALETLRSGEWLTWALNGRTPWIFPLLTGTLGLVLCLPVLAFREWTAPVAEVAQTWVAVSESTDEVRWVRADEWRPPVVERVQWIHQHQDRVVDSGRFEKLFWDGQRWMEPSEGRVVELPSLSAWTAGAPVTERCAWRSSWAARSGVRARALLMAQAMTVTWTVWSFASAGWHVFRRGQWGVGSATLVALLGQGAISVAMSGALQGVWSVSSGVLAWALAVGPLSLFVAGGRSWTTERSA